MTIAKTIQRFMANNQTEYELRPHPSTGSSRETAAAAHVYEDHIAKAVILRDRSRLVMAVIPGDAWVKLDAVDRELDGRFELAQEAEIDALFRDCTPGAVPPLGPAYGLETIVDEALASLASVYFEAGDHQSLLRISGDDFHRLLSGCRHGHFSKH